MGFASALVLFNAGEHLAAIPLFDTAAGEEAAADGKRLVDVERPLRFYRKTNFLYLGRALEALPDLEALLGTDPSQAADDDLYLSLLHNIGGVHDALGDKEQALEYFNQALTLRLQVGDRFGEITTRWWLGILYADQGDLELAEEHLFVAVEIAEAVQSPHEQAVEQALVQVRSQLAERDGK